MDFSVQVFLSAHTFYPSKLAPYGIVPHCSIWMLPRIGCRRCLILCVVQECYFWECYLTTIANMRDRPFPFQFSYIICFTYQHGKRKWPDNPRNSFPSHTKHDNTAPGKNQDETGDILARSSPSDRKIEKLLSSAIGNTRTQTRNQPLILDQWALMSFHILFSVPSAFVNSESATLLYGFLCSCFNAHGARETTYLPLNKHFDYLRLKSPSITDV